MGFGTKTEKFKSQNYKELRAFHLEQGSLFVDPAFPAVDAIMGQPSLPPDIEWKRPKDIVSGGKLFGNKTEGEETTVRAGLYSSNSFVSSVSILSALSEIRNKVIPDYWEHKTPVKTTEDVKPHYCGIYRFRLWRFGTWQEVVIDDLLPTANNQLLTTASTDPTEFWPALLEKAYAKLVGGYKYMMEDDVWDVLVDYTGGISEIIDIQSQQLAVYEEQRAQFLQLIAREMQQHSIITFNMPAVDDAEFGTRNELGLIKGHTYLLTDVKKVYLGETSLTTLFKGKEKVHMIRLRNMRELTKETLPPSPDSGGGTSTGSGDEAETKSPYAYSTSQLSRLKSRLSEWQKVRDSERQRLGLVTSHHNEFWIPLEDLVGEFGEAVIIRLVNDNPFAVGTRWKSNSCHGHWKTTTAMSSSGGGSPTSPTFLHNPQYLIEIQQEAEIILQLLQYHNILTQPSQSPTHEHQHVQHYNIGLHVIKVEENRECRMHRLWNHEEIIVDTGHIKRREVTYRGHLVAGKYIVIPSTSKPNQVSIFLLRLVSNASIQLRELKDSITKSWWICSCISPNVEWVTVITIKNAEGLDHNNTKDIHAYCVIDCEGNRVRTDVAQIDSQPVWNKSYIFYRKHTNKPLHISVYTHNRIWRDKLLGDCLVPGGVTHEKSELSLTLRPKVNVDQPVPETPPTAGTLHVTILTEDNLMAV